MERRRTILNTYPGERPIGRHVENKEDEERWDQQQILAVQNYETQRAMSADVEVLEPSKPGSLTEAFGETSDQEHAEEEAALRYILFLEKTLDEFDFATLQNIIAEEIAKSGGNTEDMNFITRERVMVRGLDKDIQVMGAAHDWQTNTIDIYFGPQDPAIISRLRTNPDGSSRQIDFKISLPPQVIHTLATLRVLCHEEWHAASLRSISTSADGGYAKIDRERKYVGFDEAVTERLANETLIEYVYRAAPAGVGSEEAIQYVQATRAEGHSTTYVHQRALLDIAIQLIARASKTPKETVWRGIIRGYLRGTDIETVLADAQTELASDTDFTPEVLSEIFALLKEGMDAKDTIPAAKTLYSLLEKVPKEIREYIDDMYLYAPLHAKRLTPYLQQN